MKMSKKFNRHLILNAILGCGIPTGVINGLLAYYTGHEKDFMGAAIDMNFTIAAVALILSLLMFPLMTKLAHTLPEPGVNRSDIALFASLPAKTLPLALVLTVVATLIFGIIPAVILGFFSPAPMSVLNFAILKGVYTGAVAVPVNYIAVAMAKLCAAEAQA